MRYLILVLLLCNFYCNPKAQETSSRENNDNSTVQDVFYANPLSGNSLYDQVKVDSVADIPKGTNETSTIFIKQRLQALVGNFLKEKCIRNKLSYPPKFIVFRCFKLEKEFEVWAGNSQSDSLRRILFLPVCAVDENPGTKLCMGDGKTPEGFYNSPLMYGSAYAFMWIKLNNSEIETYGTPGYGSSFKIDVDYPNALDRQRTKTLLKGRSPGGDIRIHGNCVTAGCISFENKNFLPIFLAALYHNSNVYGSIKTHVFPFRFDKKTSDEKKQLSENNTMKPEQVIAIWKNLEEGYYLFNKTHKALKITIINNAKYSFATY